MKIEIHQHVVFFSVLPSSVSSRKRIDWVCLFSIVHLSQNYKFVKENNRTRQKKKMEDGLQS